MMTRRCAWCANRDEEEVVVGLCRWHLAEYEGVTVAELDRQDAEEAYDLL